MREILFRGKRIDNGKLAFGNLIIYKDEDDVLFVIQELTQSPVHDLDIEVCPNSLEELMEMRRTKFKRYLVAPETVGQFTGRYDRNGNKVFEGDIVQYQDIFDIQAVVCSGEYQRDGGNYAGWYVKAVDYTRPEWMQRFNIHLPDGKFIDSLSERVSMCTVIGNIHDNPELPEVHND